MRITPLANGDRGITWKYRGQKFGLAYHPHGGLFGERLRSMRLALVRSVEATKERQL